MTELKLDTTLEVSIVGWNPAFGLISLDVLGVPLEDTKDIHCSGDIDDTHSVIWDIIKEKNVEMNHLNNKWLMVIGEDHNPTPNSNGYIIKHVEWTPIKKPIIPQPIKKEIKPASMNKKIPLKKNRFSFNAWMDTEWPLIVLCILGIAAIGFSIFYPFWLPNP